MKLVDVRICEPHYKKLHAHLFPGDHDEHAAVLLCGIAETESGIRLLVREVVLAEDGVDFVTSDIAYKKLTSSFVARWIDECAEQRLCYVAVHNHGGTNHVGFSPDDLDSHERGYPALLNISEGGPVGALVFARSAVAGDIWFEDRSRAPVKSLTIIGSRIRVLTPEPRYSGRSVDVGLYDRNIRLFGEEGQAVLKELKVGIIGLGGGGSLANEWLARLGVGTIIAVDPDFIDKTNLPRVVDSTLEDVRARTSKVKIAERVAKRANPDMIFHPVQDDCTVFDVARQLRDCDVIFLAGDNFNSRNVFNALVYQYLIPGFHVGVDIHPDPDTGIILDIKIETRVVLPQSSGGCLRCEGLIPPAKLQLEGLTREERAKQGYFGAIGLNDVPDPSVITLNVLSAAQAVNDLMMMFTGLYEESVALGSLRQMAMDRETCTVRCRPIQPCRYCQVSEKSVYAKGDRARLPCHSRPSTRKVETRERYRLQMPARVMFWRNWFKQKER